MSFTVTIGSDSYDLEPNFIITYQDLAVSLEFLLQTYRNEATYQYSVSSEPGSESTLRAIATSNELSGEIDDGTSTVAFTTDGTDFDCSPFNLETNALERTDTPGPQGSTGPTGPTGPSGYTDVLPGPPGSPGQSYKVTYLVQDGALSGSRVSEIN